MFSDVSLHWSELSGPPYIVSALLMFQIFFRHSKFFHSDIYKLYMHMFFSLKENFACPVVFPQFWPWPCAFVFNKASEKANHGRYISSMFYNLCSFILS